MTSTTATRAEAGSRTPGIHISLAGATKDYGLARPAVADVDLEIASGEFVSLLGPSGSGKTTTLNLISGLETLTRGTVSFDGTDVSDVPAHRRNLGMLFQSYALFPHMTVAQNIAYPLRERKVGRAEIRRKVAEVLGLVQLEGRDDNLPKQLSGGQQQRVALARAIVFGPGALLLDEPLGALDKNLRGALQTELRRIHREVGSTFVFVTHDQEEAMTMSDRIVLFHEGGVEQVGSPRDLYEAPDTLFAARFLGEANTLEVEGDPASGTVTHRGVSWAVPAGVVSPEVARRPVSTLHVVVRPEAVQVGTGEVPAGRAGVELRVRDVEYVGHFVRVLGNGPGGEPLTAKLPAGASPVAAGDRVTFSWDGADQRLVPA
ncbi:ABC transporter ATP-binding protein [Pseudonocardia nematodicida]|uniref:ABC transporter ATP-binding protein n=1 Tax=Pseudonocardia nematodicida TaxID=1206997 RepID=A0ABV1K5U9_9PSEU